MSHTDTEDHLFCGKNPDSVLDLSIGAPGPDILLQLPKLFTEATSERMKGELTRGGALFQYGPEQGIASFRTNLAKFLTAEYGDQVDSEDLVLTTGATCGLTLTATILLSRQAVVFVENPTYFIALSMLQDDLGLTVVPVDMTEDGVDCYKLEQAVQRYRNKDLESGGRFSCMFYTIPTFHNPTGISYSEDKSRKLLQIAKENNMLIVCDDVYNILSYCDQPMKYSRLKSIDKDCELVISNGTFSKLLSPGIRLGWLEVPKTLMPRFIKCGFLQSGGATNNYTSGIVAQLLQGGQLQKNIHNLKELYGDRMRKVIAYLKENLPQGWTVNQTSGGYFLWVVTNKNVEEFCQALEKENVMVLAGNRATPHTNITEYATANHDHCFRISIAYYSADNLLKACRIICSVAKTITTLQ